MARTFISWISACSTVQPDGAAGKLAAIWFDEIVFEVPGLDFFDRLIPNLVKYNRLPQPVAAELQKIWRPVQQFLPQHDFIRNGWETRDDRLASAASEVLAGELEREFPEADLHAKAHELAVGGSGLINAVNTWAALHSYNACNFWASKMESAVVAKAFMPMHEGGAELFSEVMQGRIPNLDSIRWEHVLELRHHPHLVDFRKRLTELLSLNQQCHFGEIAELVDEIERRDLMEIAKLCAPAPTMAIVKGIASNIPLPIPVNPASIALSLKDVAFARRMEQKFGWLYFLVDVESMLLKTL